MRAVWLGVIVLAAVLGAIGWRVANGEPPFPDFLSFTTAPSASPPAPQPSAAAAPQDPRKAAEDSLQSAPAFAPAVGTLRTRFAGDYKEAVQKLADKAGSGISVDPDIALSEALRTLRQHRGVLAARASPAALDRLLAAQTALFKALGESDAHLCVDALYGGAGDPFFAFSASHRPIVAAVAEATIDAIAEGAAVKEPPSRPSDTDFAAFEQALKREGMTNEEIGALLDGKLPNPPIRDDRMCVLGQLRLQALKAMGADERRRIYGLMLEMMARS